VLRTPKDTPFNKLFENKTVLRDIIHPQPDIKSHVQFAQTCHQAHSLFKNAVTTKEIHEIDYYLLFDEIGWLSKMKENILITNYENSPIVIINKYSNYLKNHCKKMIERSKNNIILKTAENLLKILKQHPQTLPEIINIVTLEYCRQQYSKKYEAIFASFIINHLRNLVKNNHPLITYMDIISCEPLIKVLSDIFTLIDNNASKNANLLKKHADFFVDMIYPSKRIFPSQLVNLLKSLDSLSMNKINRFFFHTKIKKNRERVLHMLFDLDCVRMLDPTKLPRALKSIARISQLPTYQWIKHPEQSYTDAPIMQQIREIPFLKDKIFFRAQAGLWKDSDLAPHLSDSMPSTFVPTREMGLVINEKYLYELRCLGGNEFFLEHTDGDKIHCMYFNTENFAKKMTLTLDGLYKIGEWQKEYSNQQMRVFKMPDTPSTMINVLQSMGILIKVTVDKLFTERITQSEQIDFLMELLKNEFENDNNEYLILYPALSDIYTKKSIQESLNNEKAMTAVICTGTGAWFGLYKGIISRLLMNGIDVMTFSYRGHELSEGTPTDQKIFQDLEIVCHYLMENKMLSNEQILLYASCTGLGPCSQYVKKHPETNLFIDRSFSRLSTLTANLIQEKNVFHLPNGIKQLVGRAARVAMPYLANFENLSHLQHAEGKGEIALITAENDEVVEDEAQILKKGLPLAHHISAPTLFGHSGNWLKDPEMIVQFESYLGEKKFTRNRCS
jgi:hypothetical protein